MRRSGPSLRRPGHPRVARAEQRPERIRGPGRIAEMIVRHAAVLVVMLVIALAALVRLRLADVPLERDEGEYAYAGQLILKGVPPYLEAYNMKFPGTYYAYALVMALFGQTARGIHVGLMLVNTGTALIVFATARRLAGDLCAAIAATAFVLLSLDRGILGIFAHATHFVLLPALGGLLLLLVARESERLWPSLAGGTLLGAAVLMKQHALVFVPLGVGLIAWPTLTRFFIFGLLATSFLGVCPGFYFREHYFILLLPAIALLVGITAVSVRRLLSRRCSPAASLNVTVAVFAGLAVLFVVRERGYLFSMTPRELIRSRYGTNPFVEAI